MDYGFADFIWLLFFLWLFSVFIIPQLRYKALLSERASLIRRLETKLGAKVVTMIHRQEKISFFGIPIYRFISIEDSEAILRAIRSTPPNTPIAIVLHTPGGLMLAASQIAMALKRHPARKIVIVPHYAMSGGTLIALAADEIWMDRCAVLGPLDPQLVAGERGIHVPAPSVIRVVKLKGVEKVNDETLMLADIAEKAIEQMKKLVYDLIKDKVSEDKAREIATKLVEGYYTHDYPLTAEELKEMGLPVKLDLPEEVYELMELYPQEGIGRPSVEYIPGPVPRYPRAAPPAAGARPAPKRQ